MKFKYNGKIYNPSNLEKKLAKLNITINDIELIEDKSDEVIINDTIKLYAFRSKKDNSIIKSIYPTLSNLERFINVNDYDLED